MVLTSGFCCQFQGCKEKACLSWLSRALLFTGSNPWQAAGKRKSLSVLSASGRASALPRRATVMFPSRLGQAAARAGCGRLEHGGSLCRACKLLLSALCKHPCDYYRNAPRLRKQLDFSSVITPLPFLHCELFPQGFPGGHHHRGPASTCATLRKRLYLQPVIYVTPSTA